MSRWLIILMLLFYSPLSKASTFIGNGGNTGDLDLEVARAEVHDTMVAISKMSSTKDLCKCPEIWATNDLCKMLNALTTAQVNLCQSTLKRYSRQVADFAGQSSKVVFQWSEETLQVKAPSGQLRTVDAVTETEDATITLNQEHFIELSRSLRITLLTHEVFHLVRMDGKYPNDWEAIGGFQDGKSFLDTLGAATAVAAHTTGVIDEFSDIANVSRAYKKFTLQFDFAVGINPSKRTQKRLLMEGSKHGFNFLIGYKFDGLAIRAGLLSSLWKSSAIPDVRVEENTAMASFGAGYHWTPINAGLSRWNEMQLSLYVDGILGRSYYSINDGDLHFSQSSRVLGHQLVGQVHVPINAGFWGLGTLGYRNLRYGYDVINANINDQQFIYSLGVGYAF